MIDKAITLAIEKGKYKKQLGSGGARGLFESEVNELLLDPLFWQALGKALGWASIVVLPVTYTNKFDLTCCLKRNNYYKSEWKYHALRFFELKLTDGDEEKFWEELL